MRSTIKNSLGFSLIEVMVGVGIIGITVLGTMSAIEYGRKGQMASEQKYAVLKVHNQMYGFLETAGVCAFNFGDTGTGQKDVNTFTGASNVAVTNLLGLPPPAPPVLPPPVAYALYNAGTDSPTYENAVIRISGMRLQNFQILAGRVGQAELAVSFEKNKESLGPSTFGARLIKLKIQLAGTYDNTMATPNLISSCVSFGGSADQIWTKNPDSSIVYNYKVSMNTNVSQQSITTIGGAQFNSIAIGANSSTAGTIDMAYPYESIGATNTNLRVQSPQGIFFHTGMTTSEADNNEKAHMFIDQFGTVGIGTTKTAPGSYSNLEIKGTFLPLFDAVYDIGTGAKKFRNINASNGVIQTSDKKEKKEILDSDLGLDFIESLRPVSFVWKKDDSEIHYGVIAQETLSALKEAKKVSGRENEANRTLVTYDKASDRFGVRYSELIAPIIKSIQELYAKLKEIVLAQDSKIEQLEKENAAQAKEIADLKKRLDKIEQSLQKKK